MSNLRTFYILRIIFYKGTILKCCVMLSYYVDLKKNCMNLKMVIEALYGLGRQF